MKIVIWCMFSLPLPAPVAFLQFDLLAHLFSRVDQLQGLIEVWWSLAAKCQQASEKWYLNLPSSIFNQVLGYVCCLIRWENFCPPESLIALKMLGQKKKRNTEHFFQKWVLKGFQHECQCTANSALCGNSLPSFLNQISPYPLFYFYELLSLLTI